MIPAVIASKLSSKTIKVIIALFVILGIVFGIRSIYNQYTENEAAEVYEAARVARLEEQQKKLEETMKRNEEVSKKQLEDLQKKIAILETVKINRDINRRTADSKRESVKTVNAAEFESKLKEEFKCASGC